MKFTELLERISKKDKLYNEFTIVIKKNGKEKRRNIISPVSDLKYYQKQVLVELSKIACLNASPYSFAWKKKSSIGKCLEPHIGSSILIEADIKDFFGNVTKHQALSFFHSIPAELREVLGLTSEDLFCKLFGVEIDGEWKLPQGFPTSPIVANFARKLIDINLNYYFTMVGGNFTVYGDNIIVSFNHALGNAEINETKDMIRRTCSFYGFEADKFRVSKSHHEQKVLGVVINKSLRPSRKYISNVVGKCVDLAKLAKDGVPLKISDKLRGQLEYIKTSKRDYDYCVNLLKRAYFVDSINHC